MQKRLSSLRFGIGDLVECRTGSGQTDWSAGKVVDRLCDAPSHARELIPYQVELTDGTRIYALADDNQLIRAIASNTAPQPPPVTRKNAYWSDSD